MSHRPDATPAAIRPSVFGEWVRVLILAAAAIGLYSAYFTPNSLGGVDARWYATMLTEFLHQLRAGHFPVVAGRGAYDWMGGIHPFRSAPLFMTVAGGWDLLTFGTQGAFRLAHLTVLTSAVVGVLGFYYAAASVLAARRWDAALFALCYLLCPVWLGLISGVEAYMSFLTFAVIPLVLYGNVRALREKNLGGFTALAVGLAILWAAHPPIACLCTLTSLGLQVMNVTAAEAFPYATAFRGMLWFPVLALFYFTAQSEVPTIGDPRPQADLCEVAGLALAFIGIGRGILERRGRGWLALIAVGILLVFLYGHILAVWCVVAAVLAWLVSLFAPRGSASGQGSGASDWVLVSFLVGAGLTQAGLLVAGASHGLFDPRTFAANMRSLPRFLTPYGDTNEARFGAGVLLAMVAAIGARWTSRDLAIRSFTGAVVCLLLLAFRVPLISDFLENYFPSLLAIITNLGLLIRLLPVAVSFGLMAFVLVYSGPVVWPEGWRTATRVILILSVGLGVIQAKVFMRLDRAVIGTSASTANNLRTENIPNFRFDYDLTLMPATFTDGVEDPRLQLRFLDGKGKVVSDSSQMAAVSEAHHPIGTYDLTVPRPEDHEAFGPRIKVQPGQRLVLRFEFDQHQTYTGWIFFYAPHGYREYHLPWSGLAQGFGSSTELPHILMLWNSGPQPEEYSLAYKRLDPTSLQPGQRFGRLIVSEWDQGIEPISLEALSPLQVTLDAPVDGHLETCRVFLPGYVATVDGRPAEVSVSGQRLVQVAVPKGHHTVILELRPTARERITAVISFGGWILLGVLTLRRRRRDSV